MPVLSDVHFRMKRNNDHLWDNWTPCHYRHHQLHLIYREYDKKKNEKCDMFYEH